MVSGCGGIAAKDRYGNAAGSAGLSLGDGGSASAPAGVTSLAGLECMAHLPTIVIDAWYVADFSQLSALGESKTYTYFFTSARSSRRCRKFVS
jgi:hypothetical protein